MSEKLGLKKRREQMRDAMKLAVEAVDDSWVTVELYRWQYGHLPGEQGTVEKPLNVPAGLRGMSKAFESNDTKEWPAPFNVAEVLKYAAKEIERLTDYDKWFLELRRIAWLMGWKQPAIDSIDKDAMREYFDEGQTPAEAWIGEIEAS